MNVKVEMLQGDKGAETAEVGITNENQRLISIKVDKEQVMENGDPLQRMEDMQQSKLSTSVTCKLILVYKMCKHE